jgi:2-oxoglutarate ferredoxin oxidoreductase subunit beta
MRNEFATGILYVEPDKPDFIDLLGLVDEPLAHLDESKTRPGKAALDEIMESFR